MTYFVKHKELESAAQVLKDNTAYADTTKFDLTGISKIGAPAAGEGVGAELAKLETAWLEVLPKFTKELNGLAAKVKASATVYVEVEEAVGGRFTPFAT